MRQQQATAEPLMVTPTEVAEILRVHPETILRGIRSGRIPAVRPTGRRFLIPMAWLESVVRAEKESAGAA